MIFREAVRTKVPTQPFCLPGMEEPLCKQRDDAVESRQRLRGHPTQSFRRHPKLSSPAS
jgi:hypothetical protein